MTSIRKIHVSELQLGMFLHGFDGPWMKHPFWKSRFLLTDVSDVRAAQQCGLSECWIDISRGTGIADDRPTATAKPLPQALSNAAPITVPASFEFELAKARLICNDARRATAAMFNEARLGNAIDPGSCLPLIEEITHSIANNASALISLVRLKTSDDYTYMHSVAVCALMVALAKNMGMSEDGCRDAGLAGLLHDLGKAGLPLDVLNKPGKLTDAEYDVIKSHPRIGANMLRQSKLTNAAALDVCLHHHEKIDGSGYPEGLCGDQISLLARMGAVCDVYDAITSNRPYKHGWDPADSVSKMLSWHGHFDEKVLTAFIRTVGIYPTGSLVKMRSGKLAVVMDQNASALTKPVVKLFFSTKAGVHIPVVQLDLSRPGVNDAIVGREPREKWDPTMIDALWAGESHS